MIEKIHVIVAEDEALLRLSMTDYLESVGFVVYEAANADRAILILERTPEIRVIFTDIEMPGGMDGLRLAAAVRRRWPPIRIIVTSGRRLDQPAGMPEGAAFMGKPYDFGAVAAKMRELAA